jgi:type IV pilus assembly protein PilB
VLHGETIAHWTEIGWNRTRGPPIRQARVIPEISQRRTFLTELGTFGFRFNLSLDSADGGEVSDVDTIRRMASDHDLEFVDLDTYGVDPAAGEILPASLARRHHVVAIKRKFGTPVVATSDPDDLNAQDTVRASIGRDFVSVVASRDQIGEHLDRLFGPEGGDLAFESLSPDPQFAENLGAADLATSEGIHVVDNDIASPFESSNFSTGDPEAIGTPDPRGEGFPPPEPAKSTPPSFASGPAVPDLPPLSTALAASVEELAELARSVEGDEGVASPDTAVDAADLVDEVVANYEEHIGEEQPSDAAVFIPSPDAAGFSSTDTAGFPPLAMALVEGNRVSLSEMTEVVEEHERTQQSIARILTAKGLVTEADLMWGMAQEMGLEFVDLDIVGVNFAEAGTIPEATARHHNVIVIASDGGVPVVAASNPTDVFAMDDLRTIIGRSFIVVVATRTQITTYIGRAFNSGADATDMAMEASLGFDGSGPDSGVDDIQAVTDEAPIVRYVNLLVLQALNERASDIHIEPTERELRIRYRIDGVLHDVSTAPRTIAPAVITRLKVMADMNIAEHRIPQDGRISLNVGSKGIDLRMATLPTIYGEKVVMRVLDKSSVVLGFADLGFEEHLLKTYEGLYTKPYGTILVTGPTGSGKSTTLYTTLTALNSPEKNIITVEDPVELPLKGVNQVQLNLKAGLNFASALRAILRSDPDIVLVGEIRDKETAVIAIEAALTGHMVLATLHTNNAASTPMRLIEMGLEPFLVTSSVSGVLAQRLARRLCTHCKQAYEPTEAEFVGAGWKMEEVDAMGGISEVYRAGGCSACANTGYRGRKALAELLPMTEEIERIIIEGGSVDEIHRVAVSQGMTTLRQSGLRKALEGETTLEEVLRVVA